MNKYEDEAKRAILRANPDDMVLVVKSLPKKDVFENTALIMAKCPENKQGAVKKYISDLRRNEEGVSLVNKGSMNVEALELGA